MRLCSCWTWLPSCVQKRLGSWAWVCALFARQRLPGDGPAVLVRGAGGGVSRWKWWVWHVGGGEVCQRDSFWFGPKAKCAFTVTRMQREASFHFTLPCWHGFCWNNRLPLRRSVRLSSQWAWRTRWRCLRCTFVAVVRVESRKKIVFPHEQALG